MRSRISKTGRRSGRRPLLALTVVTAMIVSGCGDMTAGELDRRVEALQSIAAEGRLLARETAQDRSKTTFVRVRSRELSEDADHEAEKMADATPAPGQADRRDSAVDLAEAVSDALGTLTVRPEDEEDAPGAERDLRDAGVKLGEVLESS